jgi:O-antigen ligase
MPAMTDYPLREHPTSLADRPAVSFSTATHGDLLRRRSAPVLCWAFYLFIFSIPFEAADIGLDSGVFSLSKFTGYLFIPLALNEWRFCFRRPPGAFWCFLAYLVTFFTLGSLQEVQYQSDFLARLLQLSQLLILFWISYNLLLYERLARGTLLTLGLSCSLLAVLQLLGVTSQQMTITGGGERLSAFDENANTVGSALSLGLLALIGLAYDGPGTIRLRVLTLPLMAAVGICIVKTGSRGSQLALVAGLLSLLFSEEGPWVRFRNSLIVLVAIGSLLGLANHSEMVRTRWLDTVETGNAAGRETIFPVAWEMFVESPVVGWGPVHHLAELGSRLRTTRRDTHNLFLWILTEVGLLGGIPFFLGLWLCLKAAWRARTGVQGMLPLSLMVTVLIINMSGTFYNRKIHWLVLAYALAAGGSAVRRGLRGGQARGGQRMPV